MSDHLSRGREGFQRRAWTDAHTALCLAHQAAPLTIADLWYLEQIAIPTTLFWARYDLATRLQIAEAASAQYDWSLHVIDEAADEPPLEQPEAFSASTACGAKCVSNEVLGRRDRAAGTYSSLIVSAVSSQYYPCVALVNGVRCRSAPCPATL